MKCIMFKDCALTMIIHHSQQILEPYCTVLFRSKALISRYLACENLQEQTDRSWETEKESLVISKFITMHFRPSRFDNPNTIRIVKLWNMNKNAEDRIKSAYINPPYTVV